MTRTEFARMLELTAVGPDTKVADVERLARDAAACGCRAVYTLPCFTPLLVSRMRGQTATVVGGGIGFPSGAVTTQTKVGEVAEMLRVGCGEFDMVMSFGMLMSGDDDYVVDDIRRVKDAVGGMTLKVILECHYLSDDLIRRSSELCVKAGADFIKTSTGWAATGATVRAVTLIKDVVGDRVGIKAAGGIRSLQMVNDLYAAGAGRFGVGVASAGDIFAELGD